MSAKISTNSRTAGGAESAPVDLPLTLDGTSGPQPSRVHQALREAILSGRLTPGARLPPSRALAEQLGIRRNAVVVAYEMLLADELAESRVGSGTFVAARMPDTGAGPAAATVPEIERPRGVFVLGRTTVDDVLQGQLRRAITRRLSHIDPGHLGYGEPRGSLELRTRIAEHLAVARGVRCDPGNIMITSGTQHGIRLCLRSILSPGDAAWVEDPGYHAAKRALTAAGAVLVPVPVDAEGLVVAEGQARAPRARVAYVTPSHQFPMGVVMRMQRRIELLDWARAADAWIIEDDYDSEYRYGGAPLTALAGIDGSQRVIYCGTFSKVLFPGLRLGYVVLPPVLVERVLADREALDRFPPSLLEGAIADLIGNGHLSAHVRRMRARYRAARDLVVDTLNAHSGGALDVQVPEQGLHLVARLRPGHPPGMGDAVRRAATIHAGLLSEARLIPDPTDGFILGFSGHAMEDLREGAEKLGERCG
ncbi:PLP-dependent aminotransferase family protein [Minwuia sp.]|uniref:MocR-like pyridoxine biosynthesis transcription factor PdxR n=1 Tax=Minwuia sp. TaxID=2493630 RepID=UPI003A9355B7